jgi:phage conserved hypothetical protein BR0599
MKPASPALEALLASRQFYKLNLYTLTLRDGVTILRYCDGDLDVTWDGHVFSAGGQTGPYFGLDGEQGGRSHFSIGLSVDTFTVNIDPGSAQLLGNDFKVACRYGVLDGATLQREVAIMPIYGDTTPGTIIMFFGNTGELDIHDQEITINVNAPTELLNQQLPRNLFQPGCQWTLFDAGCALHQADFQTNTACVAASTKTALLTAGLGHATDYFTLGKVIFTSGAHNGETRSVRAFNSGGGGDTVFIWPPLSSDPAVGDTFSVFPGCNKSITDPNGCPKFANQSNFRGFPRVPVAETAI